MGFGGGFRSRSCNSLRKKKYVRKGGGVHKCVKCDGNEFPGRGYLKVVLRRGEKVDATRTSIIS